MSIRRIAIVVAFLLSAQPVRAAGSEADRLFDAGRKAVEAGDYTAALSLFQESQKLDPAPGTLLNIGVCEGHLGKVGSAWQHLQQAIVALPPNDPRIANAKKTASELQPRIPRLRTELSADSPGFTKVVCDDVEWTGPMLTTPQPVDPGVHVCEVTAPGRAPKRVEVAIAEGKTVTIALEVGPSVPQTAPGRSRNHAKALGRPAWIGYAVGAVGVAGFAIGGVTGALMLGKKSTIDGHCADKLCDREGLDAVSSARTLSTVSTVSAGIGLVGVVAGVYLIVTSGPQGPTTALAPLVLPSGAGLGVSRSF